MLQLSRQPEAIYCTPDGSCILTIHLDDHQDVTVRAYHSASLGSSKGFPIELPSTRVHSFAVSSFSSLSHCYLAILNIATHAIQSVALQITHKNAEFTFRSNANTTTSCAMENTSHYNSLLDCHHEVWTRFPVEPAVHRQIVKESNRAAQELTFISKLPSHLFVRYYTSMVAKFENITRKPGHSQLLGVKVSGAEYTNFPDLDKKRVSTFRAGEWLVELLCLIPIHIVITHDNQFFPVKDGIKSMEFERTLLGATVEEVTNSISFGWYESIFESYMSMKVLSFLYLSCYQYWADSRI